MESEAVAKKLFIMAAWFGLLTGLVEGILFLTVQALGKMKWVNIDIIWVAAGFDGLIFLLLGTIFYLIGRLKKEWPILSLAVFAFAFTMFLDWLAVGLVAYVSVYGLALLAAGMAVQFARWFGRHEAELCGFCRRNWGYVVTVAMVSLIVIEGADWLREKRAVTALPKVSPSPNILIMVLDTLRADHLSVYGYRRTTSPNIDKIAAGGVLFEKAFSTSSWTLPSHVSMLTGLFPYEHGASWTNSSALRHGDYAVLPEVLRSWGYRTGAFSANLFWFTRERGFGRGFIRFEDYFCSIWDMMLRTMYGRAFEEFVLRRFGFVDIPARKRAPDINRAFLKWLDEDPDRPFFAFLNYMDTHDPYLPPESYRRKFSAHTTLSPVLNYRLGRKRVSGEKQLQSEIDSYDASIAYLDDHLGRLMGKLTSRGLAENTLVIITSDHGESFGEHDLYLHGNSLYCEQIHVPLIMTWPARIPAGDRVQEPVSNAAIPATITNLIQRDQKQVFPGLSLARLWSEENPKTNPPPPLAEIERMPWHTGTPVAHGSLRSLVNSDWHYIARDDKYAELYNWSHDKSESNNVARSAAVKKLVSEFAAQLEALSPAG